MAVQTQIDPTSGETIQVLAPIIQGELLQQHPQARLVQTTGTTVAQQAVLPAQHQQMAIFGEGTFCSTQHPFSQTHQKQC